MYIILKLKEGELPTQEVISKALADRGLFVEGEKAREKLIEDNDKHSIIVLI